LFAHTLPFEGGPAKSTGQLALARLLCIPLDQLPDSVSVLTLLFAEAEANNCGRQVFHA